MSTSSKDSTTLLKVEITSFSFKSPLPPHLFSLEGERHGGGFVFDCRSLPNPGRQERFALQTGLDPEVRAYLINDTEVARFRENSFSLIDSAVKNFLERGFAFMNVSFGCTGGQHRSVFMAEQLLEHLTDTYAPKVNPVVVHFNLAAKGLLPK